MTIAGRFSPMGGIPDRVFKATFAIPADGLTLDFQFSVATFSNPVDIDWGDGTTETLTGGTGINSITYQHTYSAAGNYQITLKSGVGKIPRVRFYGQTKVISIDYSHVTWTSSNSIAASFQAFCRGSYITSIPRSLFAYNPDATDFSGLFYAGKLESIPAGLFDENKNATSFATTFYANNQITVIPSGLFKYHTEVTVYQGTFFACTGITSIPEGLFDASTKVTNFRDVFHSTSITSIPDGLFDNNGAVTNMSHAFDYCRSLQDIPSGLFDHCTVVENFEYVFYGCVGITEIPQLLFKNNKAAYLFNRAFNGLLYQAYVSNLFCEPADKATRFANVTPDFTYMFYRDYWRGSNAGTAPDLWNYTYAGTPTTNGCFGGDGNNSTSLTNYADIPAAWIS